MKKWYRSNLAKGIWILIEHVTLVSAALCGVFLISMYSRGITIADSRESSYIDSKGFADEVFSSARFILSNIKNEAALPASGINSSNAVVDMQEVLEGSPLSYRNTSGFAYSLKDLQDWSKSSWNTVDYDNKNGVIVCREAGSQDAYYYYCQDFIQMIDEGKIELKTDGSHSQYDETEKKAETVFRNYLNSGELSEGRALGDLGIISVKDTLRDAEYSDVFNYYGGTIEEKYAPEGAGSILDVLNHNPNWKGRIEDVYQALNAALNFISNETGNAQEMKRYEEGNTNLTYLYVDKEAGKVYTNKIDYSHYHNYDAALKEMKKSGSYALIQPKLVDCELTFHTSGNTTMQVWQHTVAQESIHDDYIFAVSVDTEFPIADSLSETKETYEQYTKWGTRALAAGILAAAIFLIGVIWLTAAAGKRPNNEQIYLNVYDHWFTEIAAVVVLGIWLVGVRVLLVPAFVTDKWEGFGLMTVWLGIYTAALFLTGYLSLVRRIKAKTLWKNSLLRWLLIQWKRLWRKCRVVLEIYSRGTGSKLKMTVILGGFFLFQFLVNGIIFYGDAEFSLLLAAADGAALVYFLRKADGRELILEGLRRITDGELQHQIPLERLTGEQRSIAEYINRIGEGLDAAVDNSLRNERMKTELITNVSHDIKTPLTSIINYIDLLKRENLADPKVCGYLDVLEAKAHRLKVLTEDVVEASKASTGNITLEMTDLNLAEMVHQVIGEFEEKFQEKQLTIMVHFTGELLMIRADGQRLWRVLENIFNNVVKYAMEGTRVYADVNFVEKKAVFSLKNISAQPLNISADELTERFIRGDVSRNTEGSGLGLSIAKSLTELQGGEFRLYLDGDLFKVTILFPLK